MTREHLKDFHSAITAQVMLIQAEGSPFYTSASENDESFYLGIQSASINHARIAPFAYGRSGPTGC